MSTLKNKEAALAKVEKCLISLTEGKVTGLAMIPGGDFATVSFRNGVRRNVRISSDDPVEILKAVIRVVH